MISKKQKSSLARKLQRAAQLKQTAWRRYQRRHGRISLSTYIFLSEPGKGFPVLVKSHDGETVTLIILQTGAEFTVNLDEYRQHRGRDYVLDPALEETDKAAFEQQAEWFRRAYRSLGFSMEL